MLDNTMLDLLREIKNRNLQELEVHTLINLANKLAGAIISNNRLAQQNSKNNPTPKASSNPRHYSDIRYYPEEWNHVEEIPGVDPDEGRDEYILNDPGLREAQRNLAVFYGGIPRNKVEEWLESPEGIHERLNSCLAKQAWDDRRGIKGRDHMQEAWDRHQALKKEREAAKLASTPK